MNHKITKIIKSLEKTKIISQTVVEQHLKKWKALGNKPNTKWIKVYSSLNSIESPDYVTEADYYSKVEPLLNNSLFSESYSDKNFYHKIIPIEYLPKVIIRNINGALYDEQYLPINYASAISSINVYEKLIIKKTIESGGGKDVMLLIKTEIGWVDNNNKAIDIGNLLIEFSNNHNIQEYIRQFDYFAMFNSSSVNTIRLYTYKSVISNEVSVVNAVLRIGKQGSFVDNQASGGISVGIDLNSGKINTFAVDKLGRLFFDSNGYQFKEAPAIPLFQKMKETAIEIAHNFPYHKLLGFDICLDVDGKLKIIEVNNRNIEINFHQMNNGPLFGKFTDEIINYVSLNKQNIHYYLKF